MPQSRSASRAAAGVTMVKVRASPSTSAPVSVIATGVSSGVVTAWPFAAGASFTGVTVIDTVATLESAVPSFAGR